MHCQVAHASGKLHSLEVVTCFLLFGGFVFLSHPLASPRLPPEVKHKCVSIRGQVPAQDRRPPSLTMTVTNTKSHLLSLKFHVSTRFNEPNPQPESAAVGSVTAISPLSKDDKM